MSRLAAVRAGEGPRAVVVLHGFLGSGRNVAALARGLAERDASLAVGTLDLTGHGESPPLPSGADLATLADDVLATARRLGLAAPLRLVGHSLGGRVALRAGRLDPPAVAHVTLLDIAPGPSAGVGEIAAVLAALLDAPAHGRSRDVFREHFRRAGLPEPLIDWLLLNLGRDGDQFRWRIDRAALAELHRRTAAEDLWPAVEGERPWTVHAVRGAASRHVAEADVRRLAAAGCRVDTVDGAGHFLHVERPKEVLDLVRADLP